MESSLLIAHNREVFKKWALPLKKAGPPTINLSSQNTAVSFANNNSNWIGGNKMANMVHKVVKPLGQVNLSIAECFIGLLSQTRMYQIFSDTVH